MSLKGEKGTMLMEIFHTWLWSLGLGSRKVEVIVRF